jgi:hypothetical protein
MTETLRSAGARVIEVEAVSINISLPWSENALKDINIEILEAAIRYGFEAQNEKVGTQL